MRHPRWNVIIVALATAMLTVPAMSGAAADTTEICHFNADDDPGVPDWELLDVNSRSVDAHVDHGDGFPGEEVPGTEGEYVFTEECVTELAELIFAVAYTDLDPSDGPFDATQDELLAKLIDGPGEARDGVLGPGDLIVAVQYPRDFEASGFASFADPVTVVSDVEFANLYACRVNAGTEWFMFVNSGVWERYAEVGDTGVAVVDDGQGNGTYDQIFADPNTPSPSEPSEAVRMVRGPSDTDEAYMDVDVRCTLGT